MGTTIEKIQLVLDDKEAKKQLKAIENIRLTLKRIGISLDSISVNKTLSAVETRKINDKKFKLIADIVQAQKDLDKIQTRKFPDKIIKVIAKLQDDLNTLSFKAKTLKVIPDTKEVRAELAKIEAVALTIKRLKLTVDSSTVSKSITDTNNQKVTDKKFKVFADILQAQKSLDSINRQKLSDKQIRVVTKLQDDLSNFSFKAKTFKVFADTKESKSEFARVEALKFAIKKIKFEVDSSTVGKSISDIDRRKILDKRFKIFADIIQLQKDLDRIKKDKLPDKHINIIAKQQNDLNKLFANAVKGFKAVEIKVIPKFDKLGNLKDVFLRVKPLLDKIPPIKDLSVKIKPFFEKLNIKDLFVTAKVKSNAKDIINELKGVNSFKLNNKALTIKVNGKDVIKEVEGLVAKDIKPKTIFIATNKGTYQKDFKEIQSDKFKEKKIPLVFEKPKEIKVDAPKIAPVKIPVQPSQITPTDFFKLSKVERDAHKQTVESKRQIDINYMQAKIEDGNRQIAINRKIADEQKKTAFEQKRDQTIGALPISKRVVDVGSITSLKAQQTEWKRIRDAADAGSKKFIEADGHVRRLTQSLKSAGVESKGIRIDSPLIKAGAIGGIVTGVKSIMDTALMAKDALIGMATGIFQAVQQGAQLNVLNDNFIKLSGSVQLADQKLGLLRQASAGNLNVDEVQLYANKMKLLGFSIDDTVKFLDVIERKGDEVGVSFQTGLGAIQSFVLTGRGLALKEAGLSLPKVKDEIDRLAKAVGKTTAELADEELQAFRTQAILNLYGDSLENIGKKELDQADKVASLVTGFQTFQNQIKSFLANAAIPFIDAITSIKDEFNNQLAAIGITGDFIENLKTNFISLVKEGVEFLVSAYKETLLPAFVDVASEIKNAISDNPDLIESLKAIAKGALSLTLALDVLIVKGVGKFITTSITLSKILTDVVKVFVHVFNTVKDFGAEMINTGKEIVGFGLKLWGVVDAIKDFGAEMLATIGKVLDFGASLVGPVVEAIKLFVDIYLQSIIDKIQEVLIWMDRVRTFGVGDIIRSFKDEIKDASLEIRIPKPDVKDVVIPKDKLPTGSKTGSKGKTDTEKENDAFDELIKKIQARLGLIEKGNALQGDSYASLINMLEAGRALVDLGKDETDNAQRLNTFLETRKVLIEGITKQATPISDLITKQLEELDFTNSIRENALARFTLESETNNQIEENRINLMNEGFGKREALLKKEFEEEMKRITDLQEAATLEQKEILRTQARDKFAKGKDESVEGLRDELLSAFGEGIGSVQSMMDILGVGADTFITKLLSGFENIIALLQGFFSTVKAISEGTSLIKSIIGIFTGGLGGIFGGSGASPAGMPSAGGNIAQQQQPNIVQFDNKSFERMLNSMQVTLQRPEPRVTHETIVMVERHKLVGGDIVSSYERTKSKQDQRLIRETAR